MKSEPFLKERHLILEERRRERKNLAIKYKLNQQTAM